VATLKCNKFTVSANNKTKKKTLVLTNRLIAIIHIQHKSLYTNTYE